MATPVTSELINESDSEVVVKHGNAGAFVILSMLTGKGDRFSIKSEANATYREYLVATSNVQGSTPFIITSDDFLEHERILIRNGRDVPSKLELIWIKRGVSVTEVINKTDRSFKLKDGSTNLEAELGKGGEYLIQRDPKDKSTLGYSLKELPGGDPIPISIQDLAANQRITISVTGEGNLAVTNLIKVPRGLYLTEVFNNTSTEFKVKCREAIATSSPGVELATLRKDEKYTIQYDPTTKGGEYWVEASPTQKLPIRPEDFVNSQRMEITTDCSSGGNVTLFQSVPRPATATSKKSILSIVREVLGF